MTIRLRPSYEIDVIGTEIHHSAGGMVKRRSARGISPSSRRSLVSLITSVSAGSRSLAKGRSRGRATAVEMAHPDLHNDCWVAP